MASLRDGGKGGGQAGPGRVKKTDEFTNIFFIITKIFLFPRGPLNVVDLARQEIGENPVRERINRKI